MLRDEIMTRDDNAPQESSYLALNIFSAIGNVFMFLIGLTVPEKEVSR
jgi:hypothetical protein